METNYPTLKRPKRKLCYPINKDNPSKQWAGKMSLNDVSKMFDDLDPASRDDCDVLSSPLLLDTENKQAASAVPLEGHLTEKLPRCQKVAKDVLHPVTSSTSPNLDIDLEIPFKGHGPVKTSSPIEGDIGAKEKASEKDQNVSPILLFCEYEDQEEAIKEPLTSQNPQCNGHTTECDNFKFDSPPSKVVISKPESSHKNKVGASSKESDPGGEKMSKKSQIPVLEGKGKTQRQENTDLPVSVMRQEPKNSASVDREPAAEMSTCVGKEMTAFLQKLRDAGKPKPARKLPSPVKAPTCLPEPEDEFLILDDAAPFRFSIFNKTTKKSQKQTKTSSSDKDSSTDKGMDGFTSQETQKQQELNQANRKVKSPTVSQKMKKKLKERENEVTEATPEDLPAVDLVKQDKPNKKTQQRLKKVKSKESDMAVDKPKDADSRETDVFTPPKTQRLSEIKRSQASKYERKNAKTSKAKSLKWTRKETQGSDGVKETVKEQRGSEEHAAVQDLGSLSDKELQHKPAAQTVNGKTKQNKQLVVSEGSSSDDGQVLGKRKRNPPGQWWLSCPNSTEERKTETTNQPDLKRSKQNRKSDGLLKQRNHNTNKKKIKQNKRRSGDNPDKMKATVKELHMVSSEQIEDQEKQQDVSDQDMDPAQSRPLVFLHRDDSFNSRDQIFPRVYNHSASEIKPSTLAAPASPKRPSEQLSTPERIKRRRRPPGTWWEVNNMPEDMVGISSQPQQINPKPTKTRKGNKARSKQSRSPELRSLKKGNAAVSSKPPGGAPVNHLELRPLLASETVKPSRATFKDIAVLNNGGAGQNNRRDVTVCPAEGSATDCPTFSKTNKDILSMDAGEFNHESPPARGRPSTSTVFRSGPSSMIELQQYEENDDMVLPSSRVVCSTLSVLDLCAPPLKPLILQARDKVNLAEWLKCLWPATVNKQAEITPDQFDWYFYQGRAIGFLQDLQCGSFANGKILLGSYMKKPLWVDHSATTVFNLLTSSVSVTIDCNESRFNPGQSFMVQCGHAYSIQNLAAQPAVLYYTRILAESPD